MKTKLHSILLIDDDSEDNYFHQMTIDEMNITELVEVALNGFAALDYLKKENQTPPELVFLDINMPKMSGWEFLAAHAALDESQKAKVIVIMISSATNPEDIKRAAQFQETITFSSKPLTESALTKIVAQYFPDNVINA